MSKCAGTPSTRSQRFSLSVSRKNPRRWARHEYSMLASSSRAISSAILFSKPSNLSFENGRLFGSAVMRRTRLVSTALLNNVVVRTISKASQRKDIQVPSLRRRLRQVFHRIHETKRGGGVARVES